MLTIIYRNELGLIEEQVDMYGIEFSEGIAVFNDKKIDVNNILRIAATYGG